MTGDQLITNYTLLTKKRYRQNVSTHFNILMDTGAYLEGTGSNVGAASNEVDFEINADGSVDIHWSAACTAMINCASLNKGEQWFHDRTKTAYQDIWFVVPPSIERI